MSDKIGNSITIPSALDQIVNVDEFVEGWLRRRNVPEDMIVDLAIAITELVNNAIKHGNKKDLNKMVTVRLLIKDGKAQATIADQGEGFDPETVPSPIAEENLLKEIGRGIFIVKSLMDEVEYSFPEEGGTAVTITKRVA